MLNINLININKKRESKRGEQKIASKLRRNKKKIKRSGKIKDTFFSFFLFNFLIVISQQQKKL